MNGVRGRRAIARAAVGQPSHALRSARHRRPLVTQPPPAGSRLALAVAAEDAGHVVRQSRLVRIGPLMRADHDAIAVDEVRGR